MTNSLLLYKCNAIAFCLLTSFQVRGPEAEEEWEEVQGSEP